MDGSKALDTNGISYDLTAATLVKNDLPALSGIGTQLRFKIGLPSSPFKACSTGATPYPADSVRGGGMASTGKWAYRGSDYKIVWQKSEASITAQIYDLTNAPDASILPRVDTGYRQYNLVPYTNYGRPNTMADSANGWCFVNKLGNGTASSTLIRGTTSLLYLCGGYVNLRDSAGTATPVQSLVDRISNGDTWIVYGNRDNKTGPSYNVFLITGTPETPIGKPDPRVKLHVRAVPNPYVVTNTWETNTWDRKLAFTGLPVDCDIRIYTLAGDLVRHIVHHATADPVAGQDAPQKDAKGGTEFWDLLNNNQQLVASGVYIFYVSSPVGEQVGKFSIIR